MARIIFSIFYFVFGMRAFFLCLRATATFDGPALSTGHERRAAGYLKKALVRPMRPLAVTAAEGLDARGRRLAKPEEVEGACASQSGEGLLNKDN